VSHTHGVNFDPWIRDLKVRVTGYWSLTPALKQRRACAVVAFSVHRDGSIGDVTLAAPSVIDEFNKSAKNAVMWSNPTSALPADYPGDRIKVKIAFFSDGPPDEKSGAKDSVPGP